MSEGTQKKQEKTRKFQAIRGTRDLLPPETALWNRVEQTAHEVFGTFGFGEIRLPIFEPTELFARAVGGETDIVSKEMYSFVDYGVTRVAALGNAITDWPDPTNDEKDFSAYKSTVSAFINAYNQAVAADELHPSSANKPAIEEVESRLEALSSCSLQNAKSKELASQIIRAIYLAVRIAELGDYLTLRPEATASVCRAYIEHNMQQWPQPVKLYYLGPMFRRERPQKGRYRQFYQIGAEVLGGSDAPGIDAEVIEMVMTFFGRLELQEVQLELNSIGHAAENCRRGYVAKLREALLRVKDKLGADSQRRIETNPLRVLDSKLEHEQPIIEKLPRIADHLCDECKAHYAAVKQELDLRGVKYQENWRLVRGLDYYMRTTFEITAKGLGSQNAVCGGGRYDGLVELLGGPPTKGIGFAIGEDRLILSLQGAGRNQAPSNRAVYIAWMGQPTLSTALSTASNLRSKNFRVELPTVEQKIGKALGQADKLGMRFVVILGENEVSTGQYTVKALGTGTQEKVPKADLVGYLNKQFE